MTYHNAVKYINSAPVQYVGETSPDRIRTLCAYLGNPQKNMKYIRLAGSSGKTVCAVMLSEILTKSGCKVGTLTMPAKTEPRDNIKVCGVCPDMPQTVELVKRVSSAVAKMKADIDCRRVSAEKSEAPEEVGTEKENTAIVIPGKLLNGEIPCEPTVSELLLAVALLHFSDSGCRICIIESEHTPGDPSMSLPSPFAAVICGTIPNSDKDEILRIKSYIRRGIREIVSAPQNREAYKIISDACAAVNCRLSVPARSALGIKSMTLKGSEFTYQGRDYTVNLCGKFQVTNATTVIETVGMLNRMKFGISYEDEAAGIAAVRLKSKFEVLSVMPVIIADSTHNAEAVHTVCGSMNDFRNITGTDIKLCLPPDIRLIDEYVKTLEKLGYNILSVYVVSQDALLRITAEELSEKYAGIEAESFSSVKIAAKSVVGALKSDEILLISGTSGFTDKMRFEVLRFMEDRM